MAKYFTIEELCKSDTAKAKGIDNTPNGATLENLQHLMDEILDPIRTKWGKPIRVNSGYRCSKLNKLVGGSATSQHVIGEAVDITTGSVEGNKQLFDLILSMKLNFNQLINEHSYSWLHISYKWKDISKNRREVLDAVKNSKGQTIYRKHTTK